MVFYILKRLILTVPMLLFITAFVFFLGQYGAPDLAMERTLRLNDQVFDAEIYATFKESMGLDGPVYVRFYNYMINAVQGDFGISYAMPGNPDVARLIFASLPISLQLGTAALVIALVVGVPLGIIAASYRNRFLDYLVVTLSTTLSSIPPFVLAPLALVVLVTWLNVLPTTGFGWHGMFARETLLPAALLAAEPLLVVVRFTRASVIDVMSEEYVRAARAKGLSEWMVISRHVVKNAMRPVFSALGVIAGRFLSGTIFIETVFGIKGFGHVTVTAFQSGDINTVAAAILVGGVIIALVNLAVDVSYGFLDPRVRLGD